MVKCLKVRYYYYFYAQARPVFKWQEIVREGLKFIPIIKLEWGKLGEKFWIIFLKKIGAQKWILHIFAWAKSCNFLREDLTHLGASFKPLITKIGDRPVGP